MEVPVNIPQERLKVYLKFEGPEVEDGTMSLKDIVPVLQGFYGAYAELAKTYDPDSTHHVKITAVRRGSADIVLEVWQTVTGHPDLFAGVGAIFVTGAHLIVKKIIGVVRLKRHVKRRPFKAEITGDNNIVVLNSQNVSVNVPKETHDTFESRIIDRHLDKLTSPLVIGRIDAAELETRPTKGEALRERITAEERHYFEVEKAVDSTTGKTKRIVTLNSLYKSTNNGTLRLPDGTLAPYRYKGDDNSSLYSIFGSENGPVLVQCEEKLDQNKKVVSLDIFTIERLQLDLFDPPTAGSKRDSS